MQQVVILLIVFTGMGALYAARPSSRNLQPFSDPEMEAEVGESQDIKLSDDRLNQQAAERITFLGPKTGWGFVAKECSQYSLQGKNIGSCSAGDLFKYSDVLSSSKNDMLLVVIRVQGGWGEPCLLPCDGIAAYDGDPEKIDIQIVANLRKYFLLSGRVESRKKTILQKEYQKNPFYELYQAAAQDYNRSIDVAQEMLQAAEQLSGLRKTKADEELREFKYKQAQLHVRMKEVARKYREWKKNNPVDISKIKDAELHELSSEMESVKAKVAHLIPHEETY